MIKIGYPRWRHGAGSYREISPSTYDRFVAIANTERFRVLIIAGEGIAWEMWVSP